jgi:RNA polymerase sigma-70 factor (ECF subfamily)
VLLLSLGDDRVSDVADIIPISSPPASPGGGLGPQQCAKANARLEFGRQIENEIPFLRRVVRRWHREQADADDLVQDTLVRALANAHLWQPGSDLRAWLFTIMRNQFFAVVTKSNRWASLLESLPPANSCSTVNSVEARLTLRDVGSALHRLPGKQRSAVHLVGVEGKSYEEVASTMGTSVGAVRCHLARARDRLRTAVHGAEPKSPFRPHPAGKPLATGPGQGWRAAPSTFVLAGAD